MGDVAELIIPTEAPSAMFRDAKIVKFSHKINPLGVGVAKLEIEIESDNPDEDFKELLGLMKWHCSLGIQGGKVKIVQD